MSQPDHPAQPPPIPAPPASLVRPLPTAMAPVLSLPPWSVWLMSGAMAGMSVDCVLFPLDTIKTRMQSKSGLHASGGFGKLFAGIASAAAGSAPTAALFFLTYESSKSVLAPLFHSSASLAGPSHSGGRADAPPPVHPIVHCMSASMGEVVACLVRVPTENVKQKVQAGQYRTSFECFRALMKTNNAPPVAASSAAASSAPSSAISAASVASSSPSPLRNFYRGFGTTILREIPFALIQFPLYEWGKVYLARIFDTKPLVDPRQPPRDPVNLSGWQCASIGSVSGGVAAALTTPLDVIKTRLMLQQHAVSSSTGSAVAVAARPSALSTFTSLHREGGVPRLFSGVVPRVLWISIGGFVFFGAYEGVKARLERWSAEDHTNHRSTR